MSGINAYGYGSSGAYSNANATPSDLYFSTADRKSPDSNSTTPSDCDTCSNRKYQDGSTESVSFKSPGHISPESSASRVLAHEKEHVSNAFTDAAQKNGKVVSAAVSLQSALCPECGRSYVSGGTTETQIKYYNKENPYQQDLIAADAMKYQGMYVNLAL